MSRSGHSRRTIRQRLSVSTNRTTYSKAKAAQMNQSRAMNVALTPLGRSTTSGTTRSGNMASASSRRGSSTACSKRSRADWGRASCMPTMMTIQAQQPPVPASRPSETCPRVQDTRGHLGYQTPPPAPNLQIILRFARHSGAGVPRRRRGDAADRFDVDACDRLPRTVSDWQKRPLECTNQHFGSHLNRTSVPFELYINLYGKLSPQAVPQ